MMEARRNTLVLLSVAMVLCLRVVLGATEVSGPQSCPVKAGTGDYSYDPMSDKGPSDWGELEGYELCGTGQSQSPIDFPPEVSYAPLENAPKPNMTVANFDFAPGVENWGLNCKTPGTCGHTMYEGVRYNVINIHFHAPSEHLLNGTRYPLGAHVVHASDGGALLVFTLHFDLSDAEDYSSYVTQNMPTDTDANPWLQQIFDGIASGSSSFQVHSGMAFDVKKGLCSYKGSLTTPPCTEGVTFFLQLHVGLVSRRQIHAYKVSAGAHMYGNARPVQPLNQREVTCFLL